MPLSQNAGVKPVNATSNVGNAILVSSQLVKELRSALRKNANSIDKLPSDRELLNEVVSQMIPAMNGNYLYSKVRIDKENSYSWFDSEVARKVSAQAGIADKGRFVNACIIAYIWGDVGVAKWCVPSRLIRPRALTNEEILRIRNKAAEIADAKDVDSGFEPTTHPLSQGDSILLD